MSEQKSQFTISQLIRRSGLNQAESSVVVTKILGIDIVDVTPQVSSMIVSLSRFVSAIKQLTSQLKLVDTTELTLRTLRSMGVSSPSSSNINYARSHIGCMARDGKLSKSLYINVSEAVDENLYAFRLFREADMEGLVKKLSKTKPFLRVVKSQALEEPKPRIEKVIVKKSPAIGNDHVALTSLLVKVSELNKNLIALTASLDQRLKSIEENLSDLEPSHQDQMRSYLAVEHYHFLDTVNLETIPGAKEKRFVSDMVSCVSKFGRGGFTISSRQFKYLNDLVAKSKVAGPDIKPETTIRNDEHVGGN